MTVLIIGGAYQGKLEFAKGLPLFDGNVYDCVIGGEDSDGSAITSEEQIQKDFVSASCVANLHLFVKNLLECNLDEEEITEFVVSNSADKILICDDICSGIVPMDGNENRWRESLGRILCALGETADVVVRMQCGIPQILKGGLAI